MSRCVKDGTDSAFTWTGPYGSGKSSLALALSALLSPNSKLSNAARSALGEDTSKAVLASLAPKFGVRRFINLVGSPTNPEAVVRQALAIH